MYYPPIPPKQLHRFGCKCGAIAGAHENKATAAHNAALTAIEDNWLYVEGELICPDCVRAEYTMQAQTEGATTV